MVTASGRYRPGQDKNAIRNIIVVLDMIVKYGILCNQEMAEHGINPQFTG
jgi:hypothetical protein